MRPPLRSSSKDFLRIKQQVVFRNLPQSLRREKSRRIKRYLLNQKIFKEAKKILFYCAFKSEPETRSIMRKVIKSGQEVFLPRVVSPKKMEIYKIKNLTTDMESSPMGFLQPKRKSSRKAGFSKMDLVLVPGLAFDRQGRRLGRGKGYYDRLLCCSSKPLRAGLVFSEGLVKKVPESAWDQRMDMVITDEGVIDVR